jgi:hypothetical protein
LILHQLGFGVVTIISISPDKTQIGDIVVKLMHNIFCTSTQVWVKMQYGARGWASIARFQKQYHFIPYFA